MARRRSCGVAATAAWMLCGCSTAPDQEPLTVNKQPVYRTGSNIAVKEGEGQTRVLSVRPDDVNTTKIPRYPLGTGGANGP
jgi:hypothetical protein